MYGSRPAYLFSEYDLSGTLRNKSANVQEQVNSIPETQFRVTSVDDLVDHLVAENTIDPLVIYEDRMTMDQEETQIDVSGDHSRYFSDSHRGPRTVPGTKITVKLPFTGDAQLWKMRPSSWSSMSPFGVPIQTSPQNPGNLIITISRDHSAQPDEFKKALESNLELIREYLSWLARDISQYQNGLPAVIRPAVEGRKKRLEQHSGISSALGIPMHPKTGGPAYDPIEVRRREVKPLPKPPSGEFKPEPGIAEEAYRHILEVIRHQGRSFEEAPDTYAKHGEEELRNMILASLNAYYKGGATGETFRNQGKTDIRIIDDSRSAFVAECKIWSGPKTVLDTLNQLTGYLTWRDCKAAIILFNTKVAGFTDIRAKVDAHFEEHPLFKRRVESAENEGEWEYIFRSSEDELRDVRVRVFLFNLYTTKK